MIIRREYGQLKKKAEMSKPKVKLRKKVVPPRKWKDGKEVKPPSNTIRGFKSNRPNTDRRMRMKK